MNPDKRYKGRLDLLSMAISFICLVHCVALPLLMAVTPVMGTALPQWAFLEWATVLLTAAVGGWAIWKGYYTAHRQRNVVAVFASGLLLVLVANLVHSELWEMLLKSAGAIMLIWAHLRNRVLSRRCCTVLAG